MGELETALRLAKSNRAAGPDGVPYEFLCHMGPHGKTALLDLCNRSWTQADVPGAWRRATIIPLPKKGKKAENPASWRPVALTSCLAKICERMIQRRLMHFLEAKAERLPVKQAGYRRFRSTEEHVAALTAQIQQAKRDGKILLAVFVDHAGAFDVAWRNAMLLKMARKGVPAGMLRWYQAFLQNRTACVSWAGAQSKPRVFQSGVAQGTCSGPVLFSCLVSDMDMCDLQFADDAVLVVTGKDLTECVAQMNQRLLQLHRWVEQWRLPLNLDKTVQCVFGAPANSVEPLSVLQLQLPRSGTTGLRLRENEITAVDGDTVEHKT
eukprot:gene2460-3762_t